MRMEECVGQCSCQNSIPQTSLNKNEYFVIILEAEMSKIKLMVVGSWSGPSS